MPPFGNSCMPPFGRCDWTRTKWCRREATNARLRIDTHGWRRLTSHVDVQGGAAGAPGGAVDARMLETCHEGREEAHGKGKHAQELEHGGDRASKQRRCAMAAAMDCENGVVVRPKHRRGPRENKSNHPRPQVLTDEIRCRCSSLGVQEIVLHDPMGQLKEHKDTLMEIVLEQAESLDPIIGCVRCRCCCPSRNGAKTKPVHLGGRNYEEEIFELPTGITRVELQLHIICETDSYLSLLEAASLPMCKVEQLARNGSGEGAGRTWNATLTAQELDQELRGLQSHLPDPQVIMVLGEDMSLAGYPPWNIQVSEIYCLGPATHVSRKHIARVVQSYFRTMQRFGK